MKTITKAKLFGTTLVAAATLLSVTLVAQAAPAASKDEDAIKARVAAFIDLFNKGDAKTMSGFFTEDATLVNPVGKTGKGRAEIEKVLADDIGTILKGAKMEMKVVSYRALGKDAAFVELEHSVVGAHSPDGKVQPPMTFHVPSVMVKKGKEWQIAEAFPYAYLQPPPAATAKK